MSLADWTEGGAEFDVTHEDGIAPIYRHHLWRARPADLVGRHLVSRGRRLGVCMHNPSIAGAHPHDNDPTMRKVIGFAERWGFSRVDVVNLGDMISTDPKFFYSRDEIFRATSKGNQRIGEVANASDVMLVAWGALTKPWAVARAREVLGLIKRPVVCIQVTGTGHPWHPLMAKYTSAPLPYEAPP